MQYAHNKGKSDSFFFFLKCLPYALQGENSLKIVDSLVNITSLAWWESESGASWSKLSAVYVAREIIEENNSSLYRSSRGRFRSFGA